MSPPTSLDARRWQVVEDYWSKNGTKCDDHCPFYRTDFGRMSGATCRLLQVGSEPADCPGFEEPPPEPDEEEQ